MWYTERSKGKRKSRWFGAVCNVGVLLALSRCQHTSSLEEVTDMWCTERSKGNRISHRHSSHSSEDILLP